MRSPTAAQVAAEVFGVKADYAGLSKDADEPMTPEHLEWADLIVVMERRQVSRLKGLFGAVPAGKKVVSLGIADKYAFMQPELVELLEAKLPAVLTRVGG
ncbi:phosphotyrosine protein phosphatase [Shimia sp. Alg240-R146]|uniref:phosphotyrosine protein phosphatase n=1 Tax=Shimia sp. Alg240-R146 TaxID=2993449 RepID=UPI0022E40A1F|nr:phosphotyrosine protein phosphatase [Shimia sp. Alg240-R146]